MQALTSSNTQESWIPSLIEAGSSPFFYTHPSNAKKSKLRSAFLHAAGSLTLAAAMLAQPVAAATESSALPTNPTPRSNVAQALPSAGVAMRSRYFAPTGKTLGGDFLKSFERFGLERVGYPVSDAINENGMMVQYFERVRMEFHPELASRGHSVLMGRLGVELSGGAPFAGVQPFASTPAQQYVRETGHSLSEPFLTYWRNNGNVELFGYPISEPVKQDGLTVQWFERARFEYHPEAEGQGKAVQLSLLGRTAMESKGGTMNTYTTPQGNSSAVQAPAEANLSEMESTLLKAINAQRTQAGLAPVQVSGSLTELSRSRSNDMATRNYFSHSTPEGGKFLGMLEQRGIGYKFAGEILARNNYPDAETGGVALESYLKSAPHKAIMLDARFTQIGVGHARSGEDEMHYFTVIFVQQ